MSDPMELSPGVRLGLLSAQLLAGDIGPAEMATKAGDLGFTKAQAGVAHLEAVRRNQSERAAALSSAYDYIVVGSGAAGSVVARRLAEASDASVLLLEAGQGDLVPAVLASETWFFAQGTDLDWQFRATASPKVNNRQIAQAMGKVLGGGTSINGMVWARGHKEDFDEWQRQTGDAGWGYAHALELYRKIEDWHGPADPERRGTGGPVFVQNPPEVSPIAPAFLRGAAELGYRIYPQMNGELTEAPEGASLIELRVRDGRRLNMPESYLYPVMDRPNLTVLTGANVTQVEIEGGRATGLTFKWQGETRRVQANAEIVLSAGAIQTPKLLMLSGIGDSDTLGGLGIGVHAHLPGVGQNFQDHPIIGGGLWQAPEPFPVRNNAGEANVFARSDAALTAPDLHLIHIEAPYLSEVTFAHADQNVWSISPGLIRPHSRGSLTLASADPAAQPVITANMLDDERDLIALRKAMAMIRDLGNSTAMQPYVKREILPAERSGEDLDNLIRDGAMSMHHPVGTAKMGLDDGSVVDPQLRVRGIGGLRVADASVMPRITGGNTQAPCVLIAERASELILA